MKRSAKYWLLGLVLIYVLTRFINLTSLPVFLDEAYHIRLARLVWVLQPFHAASDGRILNIWWMALFWPFAEALWVSRAAHLLLTTAGFATMLGFTRRIFGYQPALIAGLLFIFFPLNLFFERLALADSLSAPFIALAVWFSLRALKSTQPYWPLLAGAALGLAVLTKISNIVFLGLPVALLVALGWRQVWSRMLIMGFVWLGAVITLAPPVFVLRFIGRSDLGLDLLASKTDTSGFGLLGHLPTTGLTFLSDMLVWLGWPLAIACLLLPVLALRRTWGTMAFRHTLFLILLLIGPLFVLVYQSQIGYYTSRFLTVHWVLLMPLMGVGLWHALKWLPVGLARHISLVALLALLLWPGLRMAPTLWFAPTQLQLAEWDQRQYITDWPSGVGFDAVLEFVRQADQPVTLITFDLGGIERLDAYLHNDPQITTRWVHPEDFAAGYTPQPNDWIILDHPRDDFDLAQLNLNLTPLAEFHRPGGLTHLTLYELLP